LGQLQSQLNCLGLEIKTGMIRGAIFIHSDPGHANADNPQENEQK
jgi:IS5 family transposase